MRLLRHLDMYSAGAPLPSDEVTELHEARILLLLETIGGGEIVGLTKFAKLDFFVRYPTFFARSIGEPEAGVVESSMVRFHYGPWDHRYYQLFAGLLARGLVAITRDKKTVTISLTPAGRAIAGAVRNHIEFRELASHMERVAERYGASSGQALRQRIYRTFRAEVTLQPRGAVIK